MSVATLFRGTLLSTLDRWILFGARPPAADLNTFSAERHSARGAMLIIDEHTGGATGVELYTAIPVSGEWAKGGLLWANGTTIGGDWIIGFHPDLPSAQPATSPGMNESAGISLPDVFWLKLDSTGSTTLGVQWTTIG